jgi:catechol 2,3-dioxygenase-like lactoylglutathione lyase family enzyme
MIGRMADDRPVAIVKVTSMRESLRWYRAVGFEAPEGGPTWAEVRHGAFVLQLLSGDTPWDGEPRFTGSFYVHTPSVRGVLDALPAGIAAEWGVEERPWGACELTLQDPDGYFITFTQPGPDASVEQHEEP